MTPRFGNPAISCQPPRSFCAPSGGLPTLEEMSSSSATAVRASVRPEIQALRAVAIGCVVLYHFWPAALPAGFVGVDVFFVVSGFLITGLLLRDAERHGRVRLKEFYVRRARRILPAALVVLSACAVATLLFVPQVEWRPFLQQILSSSLYVQNWHLARDSQIPSRADLESTPVQHFWSLSVEEQFYLVWPLLIILALWLALRLGRRRAGAHRGGARGRDRGLVRARRDPDRAGPQPRVLLDALAGLGVRRGRPARHRARRRGGAAAAHARPRRVDRPRRDRGRGAHVHRPPSCSPARSPWCRCSAPRP